jgi:hypothetical protein
MLTIQAYFRNAFPGSSLHAEYCDRVVTIGVETPGIVLSALCRMLS